ncbi:MAG TPA: transaldolase family protein [Anaerolineaceae bacterium]
MRQYNGPLHEMAATTPTDYWNDSCSLQELTYAIERGAVGATSNPTIVGEVLKKEMHLWKDRIQAIIRENPTWAEDQVTWKLIEEMAVKGAELLTPVFEREDCKKGRLSIQTNPVFYRSAEAITRQAVHFSTLAPNMQVKIPVTTAGVTAIEEATAQGVNINATVSFCVPQAVAVAEAVERGLRRRVAAGLPVGNMNPVCTIMVGRLDDWLQVQVKRDGIVARPDAPSWAGVAAFKRAYAIFQERGYRARLLAAAYRHHLHWTEFIGGDVILTIPYAWQMQFNQSGLPVREAMSRPVPTDVLDELLARFPDFRRAYEPDGLRVEEFDNFGPAARTLRSFIGSYHDLQATIRDFMLPNPDVK